MFVHVTTAGINNSPIIHMNVKHYLTTGSITHAEEYREG